MVRITYRKTENHTPAEPEWEVLADGEPVGVAYRRTGTSAGYYGAWAARGGGPWGMTRGDVAAALVARHERTNERLAAFRPGGC